jgi:hypothetical protein
MAVAVDKYHATRETTGRRGAGRGSRGRGRRRATDGATTHTARAGLAGHSLYDDTGAATPPLPQRPTVVTRRVGLRAVDAGGSHSYGGGNE